MFPAEFFFESRALAKAEPTWSQVLDDYDIGVALWARSSTVTSLLAEDERWQIVFSDLDSIVACRRGPACTALVRRND